MKYDLNIINITLFTQQVGWQAIGDGGVHDTYMSFMTNGWNVPHHVLN